MATGFPTKANWAAGDVLTASALDDLAGTVNLLSNASAASGSQLISNAAGTSFAYQATPSASNPVINSSFQIWQRGTSAFSPATSTSTGFCADRWQFYRASYTQNATVNRIATGDTTNLPNIQYASRVQRTSGDTSTSFIRYLQTFETVNSIPYAGKTITLSMYARIGSNYSSSANVLGFNIDYGTGTDQNFISGFTGDTVLGNGQATTTTWTRYSQTISVPSTATQLAIYTGYTPTGTAGANDYFDVTGFQIDIGSVALPFRTNQPTFATELAACQRYYVRFGSSTYGFIGLCPSGYIQSTTLAVAFVPLPVQMRVIPTSTDYSNLQVLDASIASYTPSAAVVSAWSSPTLGALDLAISLGVAARFATVRQSATTGYLGFSAEL